MKRFTRSAVWILAPILLAVIGTYVYLTFFPIRPLEDPYVRFCTRHSQDHPLSFQSEMYFGYYQRALELEDKHTGDTINRPLRADFPQVEPISALAYLDSVASFHQAIFINEDHYSPQHRAFTLRLLHILRARGYTHFAAEALWHHDLHLTARAYPLFSKTLSYADDPVYSDLIQTAIELGFHIIPYEADDPRMSRGRYRGQAMNLYNAVFKNASTSKLIVHGGYGNISEKTNFLGDHFKQISGIDPLTIDQTKFVERSDTLYETPEYRYGKPSWLRLGGIRREYIVDPTGINVQPPYAVEAFLKDEQPLREYAVAEFPTLPVDQIEIVSVSERKALLLPAGAYILRIMTPNGVVREEMEIVMDVFKH